MSDMGTKVREMPEAQTLGANDLIYMVSDSTDYKVKGSTVKNAVKPAVMSGATSIAPGSEGLVPAPSVGDNTKYFSGDGTYKQPALSEMSDDATHRVVTDDEKTTWNEKQNALTFDSTPTDGSTNPVTSDGIYEAIASEASARQTADEAVLGAIPTQLSQLSDDSTHRLVTDTEKTAWSGKQDTLTFDDEPTDGSNNPVKSNGIYDALATKANSSDLATVATSGSYNDLSDTPTIPVIEANPSGEATAEMQKLQINSTIYKFATQKAYGEITDVDIASFSDGADDEPLAKLEVGIEAVQDLHGYDNPWVGGAGKNKLKYPYYGSSTTINDVTFTVNDDGTVKVNGTASADASFYIAYMGSDMILPQGEYTLNGCPSGGSNTTYMLNITNVSTQDTGSGANFTSDGTTSLYIRIIVRANTTASNLLFKPMIRLASVSDSTFEPYSNICPISGWTGANVTRCGKNLFDKTKATVGKFITSQGVETTHNQMAHSDYIKVKSNTTYYTNADATGMFYIIALYDKNKNFMNVITVASPTSFNTSTASYVIINTASAKTSIDDMYVIEGSEATDYEPYTGHTYTIDLDGTRYGGELDVVSGVLTVDRLSVDLGSLSWIYESATNKFYSNGVASLIKLPGDSNTPNMICSQYLCVSYNYGTLNQNNSLFVGTPSGRLYVKDSRYTSASDFKTAMNGVQLVYELATPLTIRLTPTQVKSLLGQNNIWADTGDVNEAVYTRDLNTTVNDIISRIEALENA